MNLVEIFHQYLTPERLNTVIRVILTLAIGIPLIIFVRKLVQKLVRNRLSPQSEQLVVRIVYYSLALILVVMVLNEFGFKVSALLGAAGIIGIAVGFAAQTSISNIISGIFLISEKPFVIGDVIEVGSIIGEIQSIDLLSLKLKTVDNKFVRVPNETVIKTEVTNLTRFPARRVDIKITVSYKENLKKVQELLIKIAEEEPKALKEPQAIVRVDSFGDSGIDFIFGVWGKTSELFSLKTEIMMRIKETFEAENIEIPYPHIVLYADEKIEKTKTIKEV